MSDKTAKYVGIDLGTSTSALAHVRSDGNPEIVSNADGERLTPSVVFFDQYEGVKLVGSAARRSARCLDDCRYVELMTMVRISSLRLHFI